MNSYNRVAVVMLCLHDISDIFLHGAKLLLLLNVRGSSMGLLS